MVGVPPSSVSISLSENDRPSLPSCSSLRRHLRPRRAEHVPPFLHNADAATRSSFFAVLQAYKNKPEPQVNAAVDQWASAQSPSVKLAYTNFKAEVEKYQKEEESAHSAALAEFSPAARNADQELSKIAAQQGLSFEAKQQKINYINSLDEGVKQEILKAMGGPQ